MSFSQFLNGCGLPPYGIISFSSFTTPVSSAMMVLAILKVEAGTSRVRARFGVDQGEAIRRRVVEHECAGDAVLG